MADIQLKIKALDNSEIQLSNSDIKSIESTAQSTGQPDTIYYGTVPSTGSVDINDRKGEFYNRIMNGELGNSNLPIELFANGKKVQSHIATDSDYDINSKVFSVELENNISLFDTTIYEGYNYDGEQKTLYEIFIAFANKVGFTSNQVKKMLSTKIVYGDANTIGTIYDYFNSIVVLNPYIERGTVRETLDKFCTLAQLNLMENDNGDLIFIQARPIRVGNERVFVIPAKNQMSAIDRTIILKNIIDKTNVGTKNTVIETKQNAILGTVSAINTNLAYADNYWWKKTGNPIIIDQTLDKHQIAMYSAITDVAYFTGKFVLPITNDKTKVEKVYGNISNNGISYKLTYKKKKGNAYYTITNTSFTADDDGYVNLPLPPSPDDISYAYNVAEVYLEDTTTETTTLAFGSVDSTIQFFRTFGGFQTATNELEVVLSQANGTNLNSASFEFDGENNCWIFNYKVLGRKKYVRMTADLPKLSDNPTLVEFKGIRNEEVYYLQQKPYYHSHLTSSSYSGLNVPEGFEEYVATKLEISFWGETKTISFENVDSSSEEQSGQHTSSISGNELLQSDTILTLNQDEVLLATQIADNIVSDYKNGVSTCRVTVTCGDYADEYGVVRKHWAKGEIFQVGDIVRLDKDNLGTPAMTYKDGSTILWKVTGRTFRHAGVPLIDLELQEIF